MKNLIDTLSESLLTQSVKDVETTSEIMGEFEIFKKEIKRLQKLPRIDYEVKNGKTRFYPQQSKIWNAINSFPIGSTLYYDTGDEWTSLKYTKETDDRWLWEGCGEFGYRDNVQVILAFVDHGNKDPKNIQLKF